MEDLIKPYGGKLCNLVVSDEQAGLLKTQSADFPSITLTQRQLCDLELLVNGGFSPLTGFMTRKVYDSVIDRMRLPDEMLWPIPITLDINDEVSKKLTVGSRLSLLDQEGFMLAVLAVEDIWKVDKDREAEAVYGTRSKEHPGVRYLYEEVSDNYVGGTIEAIQLPTQFDFETLRDTPQDLRNLFHKMGWRRVVAFHTSKPMHKIHQEVTLQAAKQAKAHILLHPAVGQTKPGDLRYYARVHCYDAIRKKYPHNLAVLSLLPLAVRMAGPREGLLNAIIRQNYGCSHIIVGPDHASPPAVNGQTTMFYPLYAAQELMTKHQDELDIIMIP